MFETHVTGVVALAWPILRYVVGAAALYCALKLAIKR